jgi:hypothetical protein
MLTVSLYCPMSCVSNVDSVLRPISCVSNVASVSGLSIHDGPSVFSNVYL